MAEKKVYTVSEASKVLGVSGATIRKYIKDNKLDATQYFGKWLIPFSEIEKYKSKLRDLGVDVGDLE